MHVLEKLAAECPADVKLAVTAWVFKHLLAHLKEPGSYRHLIYDRLGFDTDSYTALFDGLELSNAFHDVKTLHAAREFTKKQRIGEMKPALELCDEPDCFDLATCGTPAGNRYGRTCLPHRP